MPALSLPDYLLPHLNQHSTQPIVSQRIGKGDYLYKPGDEAPFIYLIETGIVKIGSFGASGERIIYDILQPGETFGNLHYLDEDGVEFFEFAQAATSVDLFAIDYSFFRYQIENDPIIAHWFHKVVIRRWCKAETRLLQRAGESAEDRLRQFQQAYSSPVVDADKKQHQILNLLSHQEIADLIGTTRQTASKKLKGRPLL